MIADRGYDHDKYRPRMRTHLLATPPAVNAAHPPCSSSTDAGATPEPITRLGTLALRPSGKRPEDRNGRLLGHESDSTARLLGMRGSGGWQASARVPLTLAKQNSRTVLGTFRDSIPRG
jgi:hypothetical protein